MPTRPIYLDCHATTPMDQKVLTAMIPYFTDYFGNSSSINHCYGWEAEAAIKKSRNIIAKSINAEDTEIIFTSGATEANNLAIKGVAEAYLTKGKHIITVQTEHKAIIDPCLYLEKLGFEITFLLVKSDGLLDLELLEKNIRPDTILVSVMAANNEIGVLQPLTKIGDLCHQKGVLFHSDAAQAIGKIPIDVQAMNVDLMSLTAHKIYGPKGIGCLYVRRRNPKVKLVSQIQGGGQEKGLRSGTLFTPQIVGFSTAIELALGELEPENKRQQQLRDRLWQKISQLDGIHLNGHPKQRLSGNLNITVEGVNGTALLLGLHSVVALSTGSACTSTSQKPSHVLTALGYSEKLAYASIRFGIGRFNTQAEIDEVAEITIETIQALRNCN